MTQSILRLIRFIAPAVSAALVLAACSSGGPDTVSSAPPDATAPSVPANVRTSLVTDTTLTVAWDASTDAGSGVAGYRVSRNNAQVGGTVTATVSCNVALQDLIGLGIPSSRTITGRYTEPIDVYRAVS